MLSDYIKHQASSIMLLLLLLLLHTHTHLLDVVT